MRKSIVFVHCIIFLSTANGFKHEVTDQIYFKISIDGQYEGDVVIGLFGTVVPMTVENFKTIATKGINGKSYNGTQFHRVIKRFMIQGGDILFNNGSGSISIYGKHFGDENFDIKHAAPGYISMANSGPDTNGCQFFITTMPTPWLDNRHTVFGKVLRGQRLVHKIEQMKTDASDRPVVKAEIIESGLLEERPSFYIEESISYGLKDWLQAGMLPLSFSFAILLFFHWVLRKLDHCKLKND